MSKILIVEDDKKLREELIKYLRNNMYEAEDILKFNADLVLLDINLPNIDGEYILKELRKVSNVPIIMITSKDTELDELISLNYGADQYVTKPFNLQILLAKIASLLRRSASFSSNQNKIEMQDFILNLSKSSLEKGEKEIELTKNELKILHFLVSKRGQIVSREEIINYLWDSESFIDDNTLTVNMTRLRGKLEEIGLGKNIETKRGQGYIFR